MNDSTSKVNEQSWECKVLVDNLKDAYKELIESNQKIMGILLIVIGWFVSQSNPLAMICGFPQLAYFGIGSTAFGFFSLAYLFQKIVIRNHLSANSLSAAGVDRVIYEGYKISRGMYWIGLFGQFTLLLGIVAVLYHKYIDNLFATCGGAKLVVKCAAASLAAGCMLPLGAAEPIEGYWRAVDDEFQVETVFELKIQDGQLEGSIVSIADHGKSIDPICSQCGGELRGVHLVGAKIIRGLRRDGAKWTGGTVVDVRPERSQRVNSPGFVANCEIELRDGKVHLFGWPYFLRILGRETSLEKVALDPLQE